MKSLTEHLWFEVPNRRGFVNITGTVEDLVRKSGVQEGLCNKVPTICPRYQFPRVSIR